MERDEAMQHAAHLLKVKLTGYNEPIEIPNIGWEEIKRFESIMECDYNPDAIDQPDVHYFIVDSDYEIHVVSLRHTQMAQTIFDVAHHYNELEPPSTKVQVLLEGNSTMVDIETAQVEIVDDILETLSNYEYCHNPEAMIYMLDEDGEGVYIKISQVMYMSVAKSMVSYANPKHVNELGYIIHFDTGIPVEDKV